MQKFHCLACQHIFVSLNCTSTIISVIGVVKWSMYSNTLNPTVLFKSLSAKELQDLSCLDYQQGLELVQCKSCKHATGMQWEHLKGG